MRPHIDKNQAIVSKSNEVTFVLHITIFLSFQDLVIANFLRFLICIQSQLRFVRLHGVIEQLEQLIRIRTINLTNMSLKIAYQI